MSEIKSESRVVSWPLVVVAYLTLFSLGLLDNARGPFFLDIINDLGLTNTQASFFFATTSAMGFFVGRLVPQAVTQFSLMNVVRGGQLIMGLGFASISMAHSLFTLISASAFFGVGFGILNVAQNLLILEGAKGHLRRQIFSGLHGMYAISSLISPLLAAALFKFDVSWRQAFVGFAGIVLLSFISSFSVRKNESETLLTGVTQEPAPSKTSNILSASSAAEPRSYGVIAAMISMYVLGELVISTRLSLYMRRVFDYSPDHAAILLAVFFVLLFIGRIFILLRPLRLSSLQLIEWSLVGSIAVNAAGLWLHPWFFALCGLTMAPIFAVSLNFLAEKYPKHSTEAISYCLAIGCLYIVSMHLFMGVLTDLVGIRHAMLLGLFALILALVLLLHIKKDQLKKRPAF